MCSEKAKLTEKEYGSVLSEEKVYHHVYSVLQKQRIPNVFIRFKDDSNNGWQDEDKNTFFF